MMKIFFRRIHLYLSLAAGLVILIACLTGAILVFEKDLQMALNKERYYVEEATAVLPASQLVQNVKLQHPGAVINSIKIYEDRSRSVEVNASIPAKKEKPSPQTKNAKPARQPGFTFFVNPYSGEVIEKYSYRETGFYQVFALHRWLLGSDKGPGKYIVGISTFIFLFILITGVILWWPKTRRIMKQRLKIKMNAGWKRINHDMHLVFGFYSMIFLFIFAFTGLAWSFEWFNKGIYKVTGSSMQAPPLPKSSFGLGAPSFSIDSAFSMIRAAKPDAVYFNLSLPKDSTAPVTVTMLDNKTMHESATDAVYLDQYSGQILGQLDFEDRSLGAQVRSSFKPVHTGSIWGTPSKIIAFIACLFGVSFPITGTIMWINRTRKKKRVMANKQETVEEEMYA